MNRHHRESRPIRFTLPGTDVEMVVSRTGALNFYRQNEWVANGSTGIVLYQVLDMSEKGCVATQHLACAAQA